MMIQGMSDAESVAREIGARLFGFKMPEHRPNFSFSLKIVKFGHNALDNWYTISFPRFRNRCLQNTLEQEICLERGFVYA